MSVAYSLPTLSVTLEQMAVLIETMPFATHIRSVRPSRCILSNLQQAQRLGFEKAADLVQLSHADVVEHRRRLIEHVGGNLELEEAHQQSIWKADAQVELTKEPFRFQVCTLFPDGFVYVDVVQKIPILDGSRSTDAVLTFSQDITTHFDLVDIYLLYKKHYVDNKRAIYQFIKYLGVEHYFSAFPTQQELLTLLNLRKDAKAKYVARALGLSDRTVEEYKARLRSKMSRHVSLEKLLLKLRNLFKQAYSYSV